ncbi:hypothetical protein Pan97_24850 [Bremerella volcania]|uniref:Uncharacterized protein n=1 Tax=Bremerella volcania TaxID=2527984 RepID=A0A518C8A4_9BACT|nr:hypothetical protein [Bremerella volcania]QDU75453.1 hypothetical protein Pan97_24850 [Bremerella volcania]
MAHLAQHVEAIRESYHKAISDGEFTAVEGMILVGKIGQAVEHLAETFVGDDQHFEMELAAGRAAYAQYIAPIDIPNVPNFLEGWLDQGILGGLEEGARALRQRAIANNPHLAPEA